MISPLPAPPLGAALDLFLSLYPSRKIIIFKVVKSSRAYAVLLDSTGQEVCFLAENKSPNFPVEIACSQHATYWAPPNVPQEVRVTGHPFLIYLGGMFNRAFNAKREDFVLPKFATRFASLHSAKEQYFQLQKIKPDADLSIAEGNQIVF